MDNEKENLMFRKYLWLNHGCSMLNLYGDDRDGEMLCDECRIDFKRDSAKYIFEKLKERDKKFIP